METLHFMSNKKLNMRESVYFKQQEHTDRATVVKITSASGFGLHFAGAQIGMKSVPNQTEWVSFPRSKLKSCH